MGNQPICSEMIAQALKCMTFIGHGKASSYTRAYFWPILKPLFGYIPNAKKNFFSQFSEENSQFQVLKIFENKSSICLVKVGLKMCVKHVYSGFPITKISVV